MKGLIWYLNGEYASFRPPDTTSIIETMFFPPKTAIIGMIGAACGWRERDLIGYYDKIKVGIKIERVDSVFSDLIKIWKVAEATKKSRWLYIPENKIYTFEELQGKIPIVVRDIYVVIKQFLYKPKFVVYIAVPQEDKLKLIGKIEEALKDPEYPITLGDSDSLFYPEGMDYVKKVEIQQNIKSKKFHCLLDKEVAYNEGGGIKIREDSKFILYPRQKSMLIKFEEGRKPKKKEIICFIGEIELEKEIDAYEFNGEPIYLF